MGFNKGQTSDKPVWDVDGNVFNWGGKDKSAAEVEKAGKKGEEDIVKNSYAGVAVFNDAANGDFGGKFVVAPGATGPTTGIGDPRWTLTNVTGYAATIGECTGGTVKVDKDYAAEGDKIYATFTPAEGYSSSGIVAIIKNDAGEDVTSSITFGEDETGSYLIMPGFNITVSVVFQPLPKFYIIGDMNSWDRTAMTEMTYNAETEKFEFEFAPTTKVFFAFSDKQFTEAEAAADADWSIFNSTNRYALGEGDVEAPLNEVLAAGIIMLTGWKGECDLIDPMCGSGTIAIEAALIARGIAPGVYRKEYAFEKWPDFDQELFDSIYEDESREHEFEHHIYGYDINHNAVAIATTNVKAAGLSKEITIQQQDFADFKQPEEKAIIITNPPYGERISAPDLLGLYKMIGSKFKHDFTGNDAWVLSYREECFDQIGLKPSLRTPLYNGSLECELRKYQMFSGKFNDMRAGGGDIKTAQERRMMADRKRFKQHRDFKEHLEDDPRERFTRKKDREDYRRDSKKGDFRKESRGERKDYRGDARKDFRSDRKPFDKNKPVKKYGKKRYDDED